MRRIFEQLPYFLPAEPAPFARLFLTEGIRRKVAKGELLTRRRIPASFLFGVGALCLLRCGSGESPSDDPLCFAPRPRDG